MVDRRRIGSMPGTNPSKIIAELNALNVGEMSSIRGKLDEARRACLELDQAELADRLVEASQALERADLKTYRKRVESVVARLGHLR
jgi:hypothetical protein